MNATLNDKATVMALASRDAPPKDPATALFERKLRLSADLQCRDLLTDLEAADDALIAALGQKAIFDQDILNLRVEMGDLEDLAALRVVGKNDIERKGRLIEELKMDAAYQAKRDAYRHECSDTARLEVEIEKCKRRGRRIERAIDYRTSVLNCLGA